MKILNQLMSLLLSVALFTQGLPLAYAQNAVNEVAQETTETDACNKSNQPVNGTCCSLMKLEGGICVPKELKTQNGCSNIPNNGTCCSSMELSGGSCVVKPPVDASLTPCSSARDCSPGRGCLSQTTEDLFSNITNDDERRGKQNELSIFLENRANGQNCESNLHCNSYNCVPRTFGLASICEEKKVCRYLRKGEAPVPGVSYLEEVQLEPLVPVGEFDPEGKKIFEVFQQNGCDMKFNPELKQAGLIAIKAIRGMEWYFGTMAADTPECTSGAPKQLRALGEAFQNARKPLLKNLSTSLNNIEADFKKLMEASWKYGKFEVVSGNEKVEEKLVDVHADTENKPRDYFLNDISDQDLATRQSSGLDTLIMMQRRNQTFMDYEQGMLGIIGSFAGKITGAGHVATTIGECSQGNPKYKVRPFLWWITKKWNGVDKWYMQYDVKSGGAAVNEPEVAEALALISGERFGEGQGAKASAPGAFTGQHYLIDPIPFEGLGLSGRKKDLGKSSGFLGLPIFGGFEDLRNAKYLEGYNYGSLRGALERFYKKLRSGENFIYEPELQTPDEKIFAIDDNGHVIKRPIVLGRDCIEKPNEKRWRYYREGDLPHGKIIPDFTLTEENRDKVDNLSPYEFDHFLKKNEKVKVFEIEVCKDFKDFLKRVQGEGFAQFLAYGHSEKEYYTFNKASNYRRKLFSKLMVDFSNLKTYYENLIKVRKEQMTCVDNVIKALDQLKIVKDQDDNTSDNEGITPGDSTNYKAGKVIAPGDYNYKSTKLTNPNSELTKRKPFLNKFSSSSLKSINGRTTGDNIGEFTNFGGSGSLSSADAASFAILKDKLKSEYEKAKAQGIDVEGKRNDYKKLVSGIYGNGAGQGSISNSAGMGGLGKLGGRNLGEASLGGDLKGPEISGPTGEIHNSSDVKNGNAKSTAGVQGGSNSGSYSGFGANSGYASGSGSGDGSTTNGSGAGDSSGMTDAQKNAMFDEYNKNKKDYESSEDDTIFKTVSKAYVRNLDKILIKKKVEENP
jgi:hypothetical protein